MRPGKPRRPSRVAAALAAVFVMTGVGAAPPATGILGQELVRVEDGARVRIAPGAEALHIVFFAVWCPPCVEELGGLRQLEARWNERGYRLVLIGVERRQTAERLEEFRREYETPGELLFDAGGTAQQAAGVEGLPMHLILDADGRELLRAGSLAEGVSEAIESRLGHAPSREKR